MLKALFSFQGRINRAKFFWYSLLVLILSILMDIGLSIIFVIKNNLTESIVSLIGLLFLYPILALIVKRYHDKNQTGKWYVIGLFALAVLNIISINFGFDILGYVVFGGGLILLIAYLDLLFTKGTVGPNKYGEDPIAEHNKSLSQDDVSKKKHPTRQRLLALNLLIIGGLWFLSFIIFWVVGSVVGPEAVAEPGLIDVIKQFVNRGLGFLSLLGIPGTIVGIVLLSRRK